MSTNADIMAMYRTVCDQPFDDTSKLVLCDAMHEAGYDDTACMIRDMVTERYNAVTWKNHKRLRTPNYDRFASFNAFHKEIWMQVIPHLHDWVYALMRYKHIDRWDIVEGFISAFRFSNVEALETFLPLMRPFFPIRFIGIVDWVPFAADEIDWPERVWTFRYNWTGIRDFPHVVNDERVALHMSKRCIQHIVDDFGWAIWFPSKHSAELALSNALLDTYGL